MAPIPGLDAVVDPALEGLNESLMLLKTGVDGVELLGGDEDAEAELIGEGIGLATLGLGGGLSSDADKALQDTDEDESTTRSTRSESRARAGQAGRCAQGPRHARSGPASFEA